MEPLPTRLSPVRRVPKRSQRKTQRREAKKRHRARETTTSTRAQRAAEKAATHAEVQARTRARELRRAEHEAEAQLRTLARVERRAATEARTPASQLLPRVCVHEHSEEHRERVEESAATRPPPLPPAHQVGMAMREAPEEEPSIAQARCICRACLTRRNACCCFGSPEGTSSPLTGRPTRTLVTTRIRRPLVELPHEKTYP